MSKRKIGLLLLLVLAAVLLLAVAPAWARLGGGLGGESFGGEGGGGGFGGFGGGGFGGFGGGGFGFFPIFMGGGFGSMGGIITIIVIILLFNWVRNARFRSGGRQGSWGRTAWQRSPRGRGWGSPQERNLGPEPNNLVYERAFAKAMDYTRKNMDYYGDRFPYWDRGALVGRVKQAFFVLQDAWSRQDLSDGREYLTPDLYRSYEEKLARMEARGERDVIRDISLRDQDVSFIFSHMDEENQSVIVMLFASMYDYVVNSTGAVVSGNRDKKLYFREFWEFVWQDDLWKLAAIHEEDSVTIARIKNMDLS